MQLSVYGKYDTIYYFCVCSMVLLINIAYMCVWVMWFFHSLHGFIWAAGLKSEHSNNDSVQIAVCSLKYSSNPSGSFLIVPAAFSVKKSPDFHQQSVFLFVSWSGLISLA